jgi:hypothetical protein
VRRIDRRQSDRVPGRSRARPAFHPRNAPWFYGDRVG